MGEEWPLDTKWGERGSKQGVRVRGDPAHTRGAVYPGPGARSGQCVAIPEALRAGGTRLTRGHYTPASRRPRGHGLLPSLVPLPGRPTRKEA